MLKAVIVGASGYSGAELLRLLSMRDDVRVEKVIASTSAGKRVDDLYPVFAERIELEFEPFDAAELEGVDVAFIALPSGEAMKLVPQLIPSVPHIIDLSGDFRLASSALYGEFYHLEHFAPSLLSKAVYGLPELFKDTIPHARLLANPGCYATAAILALLPALKNGVISTEGIVINSLSGASGAGRTASFDFSFTEIHDNIRAYKLGTHQHIPEIQSVLEKAIGKKVSVSFVPHLVPVNRGIYTTIHADLKAPVTEAELIELHRKFYDNAPFVRIQRHIPQIKDVLYTNYCDIYSAIQPRTNQLILISVIDNLVKGAAGQAVQNMNIMFGLPEERGLR